MGTGNHYPAPAMRPWMRSRALEARSRITIARTRRDVWAVLTDPGRRPQWVEGVTHAEKTGDGPLGVGSVFRETMETKTGATVQCERRITAFDPPRRLRTEMRHRSFIEVAEFHLNAEG